MVGIVLISHSIKLIEGLKELATEMVGDCKVSIAGGTGDGRLGTDVKKITNAINEVYSDEGVLILFDLGSSFMNAEIAIECFDETKQKNIEVVDAALVEGAITAIVSSSIGKNKEEIKETIHNMQLGKMR